MAAVLGPPRPCRVSLRSGLRPLLPPASPLLSGPAPYSVFLLGPLQLPGSLAWPSSQQLFPWPGPQVQSTQQLQCTLLSCAPAPLSQPLPKGALRPWRLPRAEGTEMGQSKAPW